MHLRAKQPLLLNKTTQQPTAFSKLPRFPPLPLLDFTLPGRAETGQENGMAEETEITFP